MQFNTALTVVALAVVSIDSKSISENVTNRDATHTNDSFPDWVPFKHKQGEELGEFLDVRTKKPRKRLAMPLNYVLSPVVESEPEDYFEKDSGGEDYYERRDWSDSMGSAPIVKPLEPSQQSEILDIDGVVGLIPKHIQENIERKRSRHDDKSRPQMRPTIVTTKPKTKKITDYSDEEEEAYKSKLSEQSESELKRSQILDSVDDLKERHALEEKSISEKAKEEAMYKEERDRDQVGTSGFDKYNQKVGKSEYEDYDEKYLYRPTVLKKPTPTTEYTSQKSSSSELTTAKTIPTGRLSVFRNPSIYMLYEDDTTASSTESSTETSPTLPITSATLIVSSTGSDASASPMDQLNPTHPTSPTLSLYIRSKTNERISLVPQDNELKEGEPTLFFPRKTKKRKGWHKKHESTTRPTDSYTAGSVTDLDIFNLFNMSDTATAHAETTPDTKDIHNHSEFDLHQHERSSSRQTNAYGDSSEVLPSIATVADTLLASTEHKEKKNIDNDHKREKGGFAEHHSEHLSEHGESGKKTYQGEHENTKTEKGHHDKEDHLGKYDDHGGVDNSHHDEHKHYGTHHHEEHGKKHAEYEESGKHSKGHNTKGSHDIHKKEEYEKKVEFFEEEGDSSEDENHGGHSAERKHHKGAQFAKGDHATDFHNRAKGDNGQYAKLGHTHGHRSHNTASGHDHHGKHGASKSTKGASASGKKWIFHHGYPAKNANLVVIDRRTDQLYHGPQYYG